MEEWYSTLQELMKMLMANMNAEVTGQGTAGTAALAGVALKLAISGIQHSDKIPVIKIARKGWSWLSKKTGLSKLVSKLPAPPKDYKVHILSALTVALSVVTSIATGTAVPAAIIHGLITSTTASGAHELLEPFEDKLVKWLSSKQAVRG